MPRYINFEQLRNRVIHANLVKIRKHENKKAYELNSWNDLILINDVMENKNLYRMYSNGQKS